MENASNLSQSLPWHMNVSLAIPHHHCCSSWTTLSTDPVMDVWILCKSSACLQWHPFLSLHLPQDVNDHGKFQGCRATVSIVFQEDCIPSALKMLLPSALQKGTLQWGAHTEIIRLNHLPAYRAEVALCEEVQVALCSLTPKFKKENTLKTETLQPDIICLLD